MNLIFPPGSISFDDWRRGKDVPDGTDKWAMRSADRTSGQLMRLMSGSLKAISDDVDDHDIISRLLIHAFPDRIARMREDDGGRFVLVQGRGVRFTSIGSLSKSPFIVLANMDAGEKGEGIVHIAAPLTEKIIREECSSRIEIIKRIEWDKRENRIAAAVEEHLGAVMLSVKPFQPSDEDTARILCGVIKSTPGMLLFAEEAQSV